MGQGKGCDNCPHPTCPNSFLTQGVCGCVQDNCDGVLMLDPQSHPKWRLTCNQCPSVVGLFEGAGKVRISDNECVNCGAQQIRVDYKDKSPLPEAATTWTGCAFCEESVKSLLNLNHAYITSEQKERTATNRGRGRGRGRGGGRGRGRGGGRSRGN